MAIPARHRAFLMVSLPWARSSLWAITLSLIRIVSMRE